MINPGQNFQHQLELSAVLSAVKNFMYFFFNFRWTKFLVDKIFRWTKFFGGQNFRQQARFSALLFAEP